MWIVADRRHTGGGIALQLDTRYLFKYLCEEFGFSSITVQMISIMSFDRGDCWPVGAGCWLAY